MPAYLAGGFDEPGVIRRADRASSGQPRKEIDLMSLIRVTMLFMTLYLGHNDGAVP